ANTLVVGDAGDQAATTTVLTRASVEQAGAALIVYFTTGGGTFAQVLLRTGQGGATVNVRSTLATAALTTIQAGAGDDHVTVSTAPDGNGTLEFLAGPLFLDAGGGSNTLVVSDAADPAPTTTVLTQASVEQAGLAPVIYAASGSGTLAQVLLRTGQGA